ncbi:MAG: efflux RND transporter periplasmic adaptor subunit [Phycisphaerae bacterium]
MNRYILIVQSAAGAVLRTLAVWVVLGLLLAAVVVGYGLGRQSDRPGANAGGHSQHDHDHNGADADDDIAYYTCSMHPSVKLPDPDDKCPICFMGLVPVRAGEAGGDGTPRMTLSNRALQLAEVRTTPVARFFPEMPIRMVGMLDYDETRQAKIAAYFPGRLERLYLDYTGVRVRAGDHVAEVYSPDVLAAAAELRQIAQDAQQFDGDLRQNSNANLAATRRKLRLLGLRPEQIDALQSAEEMPDTVTVFAPADGIVTEKAVVEGEYVEEGDVLYRIADLSRLWLKIEAYENQLPWLRFGQDVTFTVAALPGETFTGRISFIEPQVDAMTRTVSVRVNVDNTDRRLKPGMFASAVARPVIGEKAQVVNDRLAGKWISPMHPEIVKDGPGTCDVCGMDLVPAEELGFVRHDQAEPPLLAPASAVLQTGERAVVYIRLPDTQEPTFEGRQVTLGPRAGDWYVITEGLAEGDQVVTNGAFKIDSAMQISAKPSMMSMADADAADAANPADEVPEAFVRELTPVYEAYLAMQTALADDEVAGFNAAADRLQAALAGVKALGLTEEATQAWRQAAGVLRQATPHEEIAEARKQFEPLSRAVLSLAGTFGHATDKPLVRANCPMAFDWKGADWLQAGETIDNPYFGAEMLECGTVEQAYGE